MFVRRVLPPTLALATVIVAFWPTTHIGFAPAVAVITPRRNRRCTTTLTDLGIFCWATWTATNWNSSEPPLAVKPLLLVKTLALCFAIWAIALKVALGSTRGQPQTEPVAVH